MNILKIMLAIFLTIALIGCQPKAQQPMRLTYSQNLARQYCAKVFANLSKGYTDRAQANVKLALRIAPLDPVVLDTAGYYFEKTGDLKTANTYYKKAVTETPTSGIVKNNYGAFLCRNGRYKASIPYFLAASKIKDTPVRQEALANAQYCYKKMQTILGGSFT